MRYRVAQFWHTLFAPWRPVDQAYAACHLSPELLRLFLRMSRAEQLHGITVCRTLEAQGFDAAPLLASALLHDAGKLLAPPHLWERVLVVLVEHFFPRRAAQWRTSAPRGLHRAFALRYQHAQWGADLAAAAGAEPRTVALILRHHQALSATVSDAALSALQAADDG